MSVETEGYALRRELERLQAELARERTMREGLERQLDQRMGLPPPPRPEPVRPRLLPWVAAVLLGMGLGALGYYLMGIPLRAGSQRSVGTPLHTIAPRSGS